MSRWLDPQTPPEKAFGGSKHLLTRCLEGFGRLGAGNKPLKISTLGFIGSGRLKLRHKCLFLAHHLSSIKSYNTYYIISHVPVKQYGQRWYATNLSYVLREKHRKQTPTEASKYYKDAWHTRGMNYSNKLWSRWDVFVERCPKITGCFQK